MEGVVADPRFWAGKRIFLTGHTGFKGSWLSLWLKELGAEVTGYALQPATNPNLFEAACVGTGMTSLTNDVRDFSALRDALSASRPEIVFHLAAQPLVRQSYTDPRGTYETNVMGTVNLLEALRGMSGVRAVVVVTSDKCYDNKEWFWGYRESEAMGGRDPYSSSKGCVELVASAYRSSFFGIRPLHEPETALATARAGNVIGGGDWSEDRLLPDFLRAIERGEPLRVRHPCATRPWQHVLDPLAGYLRLAERLCENGPKYASAWNFGPGDQESHSVAGIADEFVRRWGSEAAWEHDGRETAHEATFLKLDSSKAREMLGWRSRIRVEQALQSVVDWHKAHLAGEDMRAVTMMQITAYMAGSTGLS